MNSEQTTALEAASSATWVASDAIRKVLAPGVNDAARAKLNEAARLLAEVRKTLEKAFEASSADTVEAQS